MRNGSRPARVFLCAILILGLLCSCAAGKKKVGSVSDLDGARVGVLLGTAGVGLSDMIEAYGAGVSAYVSTDSLKADLKGGSIDCIIIDEARAGEIDRGMGVKTLDEPFLNDDYSIIAAKENADLTKAINSALAVLTENGTVEAIVRSYIEGGSYKYERKTDPETADFSLSVAVVPDNAPYAFLDENGEWTGLDIDVACAVCDILGAGLTVREEPESELITAVRSGRADFGMGRLVKTAEASELVDFSTPYMTSVQMMLVRP